MKKLTKERIEQYASDPRMCNINDEIREMARMLLAGMDQEPVAWTDADELRDANKGGFGYLFKIGGDANKFADPRRQVMLYEIPQQAPAVEAVPVVPASSAITQHFDTISLETAREIMCDVNRRHEFLGGEFQLLSRIQCRIDDACRAAMQQPVSNRDELPGWVMVPKEMTPEMMRAVQIKSEIGGYAASELSGAYDMFAEFWDVAVSAAPQQEGNGD